MSEFLAGVRAVLWVIVGPHLWRELEIVFQLAHNGSKLCLAHPPSPHPRARPHSRFGRTWPRVRAQPSPARARRVHHCLNMSDEEPTAFAAEKPVPVVASNRPANVCKWRQVQLNSNVISLTGGFITNRVALSARCIHYRVGTTTWAFLELDKNAR